MNEILKQTQISSEKWQAAMESKERIEKIISSSGTIYWLKKSAPARGIFRYYALNFFSKILSLPLIKAVPQKGGQSALDIEVSRIKNLSAQGIFVPKVVAQENGWILMENLGASIIDDLKKNRKDQNRVRLLFSYCLVAIKNLHKADQYLSQGFVRNLLMIDESKGKVGFIDFEDDPLEVLNLTQAQGRDLLLFINSTARFFVKDTVFFKEKINEFLKDHNPLVISHIKSSNEKMMWITKLPMQKALGHDYQKLKTGILALADI